jgi:hypothetical protein
VFQGRYGTGYAAIILSNDGPGFDPFVRQEFFELVGGTVVYAIIDIAEVFVRVYIIQLTGFQ